MAEEPGGSPAAEAELRRECQVFCQLLAGQEPTAYVVACYRSAHRRIPYRAGGAPAGIHRLLLRAARVGAMPARVADGYARWFHPTGPLRQKLVLLLAILETVPPYHTRLNTAETGSLPAVALRLVLRGAGFVLLLLLGVAVFGAADLALRATGSPAPEAG